MKSITGSLLSLRYIVLINFINVFHVANFYSHLLTSIKQSNWSIQPIKNGSGLMLIVVYSKKDARTCAATRCYPPAKLSSSSQSALLLSRFRKQQDESIHPCSWSLSSHCSILAANQSTNHSTRGLLPNQNCKRCPCRRLRTERGVHLEGEGGLEAGPELHGRVRLHEGQ